MRGWDVLSFLMQLAGIALYVIFFSRCMRPRSMPWQRRVLLTALYAAAIIGYAVFELNVSPFAFFPISLGYCHLMYESQLRTKAVWVGIGLVLDGLVDYFVVYLAMMFPGMSFERITMNGSTLLVAACVSRALLFGAFFLTTRHASKEMDIRFGDSLLLLLVSAGCWALLAMLIDMTARIPKGALDSDWLPLAGNFCLLLIIVAAVVLFNRLMKREKDAAYAAAHSRAIGMMKAHIDQAREAYEAMRRIAHDHDNHMTALWGYLNLDDLCGAKEYLGTLGRSPVHMVSITGHIGLDAVVAAKRRFAEERGIDFQTGIYPPKLLAVSDVDLCVLVGNMLDNAFEAVRQFGGDKPFVRIVSEMTPCYWTIACTNTAGPGTMHYKGCIPTSKADKGAHGIGTKQIEDITLKTGGFVNFHLENRVFSAVAMLRHAAKAHEAGARLAIHMPQEDNRDAMAHSL